MAKKRSVGAADVRELAHLFRLLRNETRLKIVFHLARREQNVGSLCKILKVGHPMMSYHLGWLRMGKLVASRHDGRYVIYSLNAKVLSSMMGQFNSLLRRKK